MEWLTCIKASIDYIENHIKESINIDDMADQCHLRKTRLTQFVSVFFFLSAENHCSLDCLGHNSCIITINPTSIFFKREVLYEKNDSHPSMP